MTDEKTKRLNAIGWALHAAGLVVILIAAGLFYSLVYCELKEQKRVDAARSEQLQKLLESSGEVHRQNRMLQNELNKLQETIAKTRGRLPEHVQESSFVTQVRDAAKGVGLEVIDHQIHEDMANEKLSSTEISFHCNGSYDSICKFLDKTSQFARITEISKFKLESKTNSDSYPFHVTFVLYYGALSNDTDRGDIL